MGMFDSIHFECPGCFQILSTQSKAGDCMLTDYPQDVVPVDIAGDIVGSFVYCDQCLKSFEIKFGPNPRRTVPMMLV